MAPKLKLPPKSKKVKSGGTKSLESVDDFQQAADDEESTGGKWRAGDKAKSTRAFLRAIDLYTQGLVRHPRNFNLAYNKARLEFEVAEQPALVANLPVSRQEFLQQTLQSHKDALRINEENTDLLFNTAQILITLAEEIVEETPGSKLDASLPSAWLREALEFLDACFSRQEMVFEEQAQVWRELESNEGGVPLPNVDQEVDDDRRASSADEEATVESAITAIDLLDTARSSITAMTQLIPLESPAAIQTIRSMAESVFTTKIPHCESLLEPAERRAAIRETLIQRTTFAGTLASAEYSNGNLTSGAYLDTLEPYTTLDLSSDLEAICAYADGLIEFVATVMPALTDPSHREHRYREEIHSTLTRAVAEAGDLYSRALALASTPTANPAAQTDPFTLTLSTTPGPAAAKDPFHNRRLASLHESLADTNLLRARVATTGVAAQAQAQARAARSASLLQAVQSYAEARPAYGAAGDEGAAAKVAVRWVVARVVVAGIDGAGAGTAAAAVRRELVGLVGDGWRDVVLSMVEEELVEEAVLRGLES